jgi:hypothetical protein
MMAIWGLWSALIPTGPCCGHDMEKKKCESAFEMDFWLAVTLIRSQIPQSDPLCQIISLYYILAGEKFKSLDLNSLILICRSTSKGTFQCVIFPAGNVQVPSEISSDFIVKNFILDIKFSLDNPLFYTS